MRRRGIFSFLMCLAILCQALFSCGWEEADEPVAQDYLTAVSIFSTDNALRYRVSLTVKKDFRYRLCYKASVDSGWMVTPWSETAVSTTRTLMFLYPETEYEWYVEMETEGSAVLSSELQTFRTSALPPEVPVYTVTVDNGGPDTGYLLQWQATSPGYLTFCDMQGKVVWYEVFDQAVRHVHFDPERGEFAILTGFREGVGSRKFQRLCDRILLVNLEGERLIDWVASEENVPYPHHDIKLTKDGNLLIFNNVIRNFDLSPLGGNADEPVWGEGFTVISREGKVLKSWDVFGEIDPVRDTWLDAVELSYDLLHGNSVATDERGDYYITLNRHSELWKIDGGSGRVLYRVGEHGNVDLHAAYPVGGLHSAVPLAPDKVLCYNNGGGDNPSSRAQIYHVDPAAGEAWLDLDVAVAPEYSSADRSNVELLPGGEMLMFASTLARACTFTDLEGRVLKVIRRTGIAYRSHYFAAIRNYYVSL